jgi:hypothetical protein
LHREVAAVKVAVRAETVEPIDSAEEACLFIEEHGLVLFSGRGEAPSLVDAIAGSRVRGSWWGHSASKRIFRIANALEQSPDILWCRLLGGKRTLVHRRIWPALARLADELDPERIASVRQEHTDRGAHRNVVEPFANWVPPAIVKEGARLTREAARSMLPAVALAGKARPPTRSPKRKTRPRT